MSEPIAIPGSPEYSTGIFGCYDDVTGCLEAMFCYPCLVGRHCQAIDGYVNTTNCLYTAGVLVACVFLPPALMIVNSILRTKVREAHGITGSCPMDWVCGVFCGGCSTCQNHRELTIRNKWPGGTCCQTSPPTIKVSM